MTRAFAQLPPSPLFFSLVLCFLSLPHYYHIVSMDDEDYQVDPDHGDFTDEEMEYPKDLEVEKVLPCVPPPEPKYQLRRTSSATF